MDGKIAWYQDKCMGSVNILQPHHSRTLHSSSWTSVLLWVDNLLDSFMNWLYSNVVFVRWALKSMWYDLRYTWIVNAANGDLNRHSKWSHKSHTDVALWHMKNTFSTKIFFHFTYIKSYDGIILLFRLCILTRLDKQTHHTEML